MNLNQLNEKLTELLEDAAIRKENSGFSINWALDKFIDECFNTASMPDNGINFYLQTKLILTYPNPKNPREDLHNTITLLYGSKYLGIRHIIEQRGNEFSQQWKVTNLSEAKIERYLKDLPSALTQGIKLFDFDVNTYEIREDRIIILYRDVFYVFMLESDESDFTFLLTMFRPTQKYKNIILKLNQEKQII